MFVGLLKGILFLFMVLLCLFLILIVLLQRGKGGGLVGAFGGSGGSSAFGAKTSDVFVKITVWTAIIWFATCVVGHFILAAKSGNSMYDQASGGVAVTAAPEAGSATTDATPVAEESAAEDSAATDAPANEESAPVDATPVAVEESAPAETPTETPAN